MEIWKNGKWHDDPVSIPNTIDDATNDDDDDDKVSNAISTESVYNRFLKVVTRKTASVTTIITHNICTYRRNLFVISMHTPNIKCLMMRIYLCLPHLPTPSVCKIYLRTCSMRALKLDSQHMLITLSSLRMPLNYLN